MAQNLSLRPQDSGRGWRWVAVALGLLPRALVAFRGGRVDITARHRARAALKEAFDEAKQSEDHLRASERNFRLIVDSIPGLVFTLTGTGEIELVNRQLLEYFGRTLEELKGWTTTDAVHPDDVPRVTAVWRRGVESGQPHEIEHRLRRADGTYRWFHYRALPLRDTDDHIIRWYGLVTDIEDLKCAEEALRSTQARLSRATQIATVSEIAASIAHEINQPLAAVVANGHACQRWLSAKPPNVERALLTAGRIIRDGNAAAEVIQRIRALFRQAPPLKDLLDMNEVIEEVCSLMRDGVRAKGVALKTDLQSDLAGALADRVQIQQVVANLARNGIEAMDGVTDRPKELLISSRHDGRAITVHIADHGIGISDTETVFESFFTTKTDGMGMGLAICRSIVEAHGGRLWATQNVPYGATFSFALPIAVDEQR